MILPVKKNIWEFFEKLPFFKEFPPYAGKLRPAKPIRKRIVDESKKMTREVPNSYEF